MRHSVLCLFFASASFARVYHDPAGFRVDLPEGWRTAHSKAGHIVVSGPNPLEYVYVRPLANRTAPCAATLRQTLTGVEDLQVSHPGPRVAVARFVFQNRQARGTTMCAEVSRRGAMLYGISAPAAEYQRAVPRLMAILRSFSFQPVRGAAQPAGGGGPLPSLRTWQEPQEMAYTLSAPASWRVGGGIRRSDATHYTSGVTMTSPEGAMELRINDQRLADCMVPGPGAGGYGQQLPNACRDQSGAQLGQMYVSQWLARDLGLQGLRITSAADRPDIAQHLQMRLLGGLPVRYSVGEVRFQATRNGVPVAGAFLAQTSLFHAAQGQNFILGTLSPQVRGFVGPPEQFNMLARLTGVVFSSFRINPAWWSQTQRINREIADKTLAVMRQQAENQQQLFWDRMASMDRQREGMRDILGGTVRVSDGQGNTYEARAGSNYYFFDQEAGRTAPRRDDAVVGTDVWPGNTVDLTPLEVVR